MSVLALVLSGSVAVFAPSPASAKCTIDDCPVGEGGGDQPAPTPGSWQFCMQNTSGQISVSATLLYVGAPVTVTWSVTPASGCNVSVRVVGVGFPATGFQLLNGAATVTMPSTPGTSTWSLSLTVVGNNTTTLASTAATALELPSAPAIAATRDSDHRGQTWLFRIETNGNVSRTFQDGPNHGFGPWMPMGVKMRSVAAETNKDGRVEVFGINPVGQISHSLQGTPGFPDWNGWSPLDGYLASIAVAHNSDGRLELFGSDAVGGVWHRSQTSPNSKDWTGWVSLDAAFVTRVAAETNADGRVEVFAINTNGDVWHRSQTSPNGTTWSAWAQIPGNLSTIAVARDSNGRLQVTGTNASNSLQVATQTSAGAGSWTAFSGVADTATGTIATEPDADGRIELFGVHNGVVMHRGQTTPGDSSGWTSWKDLSERLIPLPPAAGPLTPPTIDDQQFIESGNQIAIVFFDQSNNEHGLRLMRSVNSGPWVTLRTVTTQDNEEIAGRGYSYGDLNTDTSTQRCYKAVAFNDTNTADSNVVCKPPKATPPPPPPPGPETVSLTLVRQPVVQGPVPYLGVFPLPIGVAPAGHLVSIKVPQVGFSDTAVLFVKPGHSTQECNDPNAVVQLNEGQTTTAAQINTIFGVSQPPYSTLSPIHFVACLAQPAGPLIDQMFLQITIQPDA